MEGHNKDHVYCNFPPFKGWKCYIEVVELLWAWILPCVKHMFYIVIELEHI